MLRRLSTFVGATPSADAPVEMVTVEVLAGKVTIQETFEPISVWVTLTLLTNSTPTTVFTSKICEKQIHLHSSYSNQWMFNGKTAIVCDMVI